MVIQNQSPKIHQIKTLAYLWGLFNFTRLKIKNLGERFSNSGLKCIISIFTYSRDDPTAAAVLSKYTPRKQILQKYLIYVAYHLSRIVVYNVCQEKAKNAYFGLIRLDSLVSIH